MQSSKFIHQNNQAFSEALARLNEAQRAAVAAIEGPVLVIAGPGTGKTQVLTARIGNILLETDTQPHNILCLTFTDAGVTAMRERLLQWIGAEAHRVHIFTFHSFCNTIIQENIEQFGYREWQPLSDLEQVEIIRELMNELPSEHPLIRNKANIFYYERHLATLFDHFKKEGWSVATVKRDIQQYIADLPQKSAFVYKVKTKQNKKGDPKQGEIDEETKKMSHLVVAADLFPRYLQKLQDRRRYDFNDMIAWVTRAFQQNPMLLRRYQEQYLYVLIDEYQDTNGAQNHLLKQLISYWDKPNIFIVGDDDQSIYEFQGARLKNLTDFYTAYKADIEIFVLKENYRSSQYILDTAGKLIQTNTRRIVNEIEGVTLQKVLQANATFAALPEKPQYRLFPNRTQEEIAIVHHIETLQKSCVELHEIAILYAQHRQAEGIIALLERRGIAYTTKRRMNVLDHPLIQQIRFILRYISIEIAKPYSAEELLFKILHFDFWEIAMSDLAKCAFWKVEQQEKNITIFWRDMLSDIDMILINSNLRFKNSQNIINVGELLQQLFVTAINQPPLKLIEQLLNRTGIVSKIAVHDDKKKLIQVVSSFFNFVESETQRNPRLTIARLLEMLDSMDANSLAVPLNDAMQHEKGVQLMTAHASKGLEFGYVFMPDCVKSRWDTQQRQHHHQFKYPDTLTFSGEEDALEARRRLFYVAMTRAKAGFFLSSAQLDKEGKPLETTRFMDEIADFIVKSNENIDPKEVLSAQFDLLKEAPVSKIPFLEPDILDSLLKNFRLSITSLNSFLQCPLGFYYEYILKIPRASSEAATFGTVMHATLHRYFEDMLRNNHYFADTKVALEYFQVEMERKMGYFGASAYKRFSERGRQHLKAFIQKYRATWQRDVRLETKLTNIPLKNVPLTGVIDKIEIKEKQMLHLTDYKTGNFDAKKITRPTKKNPNGSIYWRQMVFYKLLTENHPNWRLHTVKTAAIDWIEPDEKGNFHYSLIEFEPEDATAMTKIIINAYEKIKSHDFFNGCQKKDCAWCNLQRQATWEMRPASLVNEELEGLDD
jgi:DNA helicase II / ATP-dependent DNA helicase PcrA